MAVSNIGKLVIEYDLNNPLNTLIKPMIDQAAKLGYTLVLKGEPKEELTEEAWEQLKDTLDVPNEVPRDMSPFAMAMLAVCIRHHKGTKNAAYSKEIAEEMIAEYPEVTKFYEHETRSVSFATIFTADNGRGGGLVPHGLLKMELDEDNRRRYWVP